MKIEKIDVHDLNKIESECLILQGCGGDPQDWVNGMNDIFQKEGILLEGTKFENVKLFKNDKLTNLCFDLSEVKLNLERLAVWRILNYPNFGGTWLSDYKDNRLSMKDNEKPKCKLIGQDGNIYNLMGIVSKTLKENGLADQSKEMCERILNSADYEQALNILSDYVEIEGLDEMDIEMEME